MSLLVENSPPTSVGTFSDFREALLHDLRDRTIVRNMFASVDNELKLVIKTISPRKYCTFQ